MLKHEIFRFKNGEVMTAMVERRGDAFRFLYAEDEEMFNKLSKEVRNDGNDM